MVTGGGLGPLRYINEGKHEHDDRTLVTYREVVAAICLFMTLRNKVRIRLRTCCILTLQINCTITTQSKAPDYDNFNTSDSSGLWRLIIYWFSDFSCLIGRGDFVDQEPPNSTFLLSETYYV
jgi:hypothetical protein